MKDGPYPIFQEGKSSPVWALMTPNGLRIFLDPDSAHDYWIIHQHGNSSHPRLQQRDHET